MEVSGVATASSHRRLKLVNTVLQTVGWEEWQCDLGEKSAV